MYRTGTTGPANFAVYLAPWNRPYNEGTDVSSIHPNVLPGCVFKQFSSDGSNSGYAPWQDQVMSVTCTSPYYFVDVRQSSSAITGQQVSNAAIPIFSAAGSNKTTHKGIDESHWVGFY